MNLFVRPDGTAQCLYSEDIDLTKLGALGIARASHVEPTATLPVKWCADLAPVGGPMLGPFDTRNQALAAEEAWLNNKMASGHVAATGAL